MDSCQLNYKHQVIMFPATRSMRGASKINFISCRGATTLEAQRVTSSTNYYEILSLNSKNVGFNEIKKAYRSMARQCHPDVVPVSRKEASTKRFVELQKAYETLSDPVSRQKYDLSQCGIGITGTQTNGCKPSFSKDVWEDQLSGLQRRSKDKKGRKKTVFM